MEIQMTTPYSPSQNGVVEHMNRTLVELAQVMLVTAKLPEFLWEPVVAHTAHIQNCSYTTMLADLTPYQGWFGEKPNVVHLREFGANVWILLQGQNIVCKILPKLKRCVYIGYDKGSKSVIYYNVETQRCLTSQNYTFLTPKTEEDNVEDNTKQHDDTCKGERETLEQDVQPEDKENN